MFRLYLLHCGMKRSTTTSSLDWTQMLGLCAELKRDGLHRDYLLIMMGCHFGLRISDLLKLTWNDVYKQESVIVKEGKTGKQRIINEHARVREALEFSKPHLLTGADITTDHPILANRWGSALTVSYINKRLKWVFSRYRIKTQNASSHTLRKTFGKRVYEMNGETDKSLVFLSEIFGHSNTAITRRYLGITQEEIADAYLSL